MMRPTPCVLLLTALLLGYAYPSWAWLRPRYEDITVVERSELIVVARLKPGSVERVEHPREPGDGRSWEFHATLVISEVIKGESSDKEVPVILHYGLTPREIQAAENNAQAKQPTIGIYDTGSSAMSFTPLITDASAANVWFLRKRSGRFGREPGDGDFGVVDPEDIQPLGWKDYFRCYLEDDPEAAVREWTKTNPDRAERAKPYLDHLAVAQLLEIDDPAKRCKQLLPYYLAGIVWQGKFEARAGIIACGKPATRQLREVFHAPDHAAFRSDIISVWRSIGDAAVAPDLIALLETHDRFWAEQELEAGWWNQDVGSETTRRRRAVYGEVYQSVLALKTLGGPEALPVLRATRDRWQAINFSNPQIVEACNAVIAALEE